MLKGREEASSLQRCLPQVQSWQRHSCGCCWRVEYSKLLLISKFPLSLEDRDCGVLKFCSQFLLFCWRVVSLSFVFEWLGLSLLLGSWAMGGNKLLFNLLGVSKLLCLCFIIWLLCYDDEQCCSPILLIELFQVQLSWRMIFFQMLNP